MVTNPFFQPTQSGQRYDVGLRGYLIRIYNYMTLALLVTGAISYFSVQSEALLNAMYVMQDGTIVSMRALAWVIMFAPLVLVMVMSFGLRGMSLIGLQVSYWLYAVVMGLSLSVIFLTFTSESIARVFFITAAMFGGMSFYGYSTRRDLMGFGSFLMMILWGLVIAMLVNLLLKSSGLQFALSIIGVLVFIGLTAYDTQKLKRLYYESSGTGRWANKLAIMGALTLYLDFINIFLNLLNLFGERRR